MLIVLLTAIFMTLAVFLSKIVYNSCATTAFLLRREQAFWLAEAGLEAGKVNLNHNPGWYTDLPHYPENDNRWLREGAVGERQSLGGGWFKVVREKDKNLLYAVGGRGRAAVVLKIEFAAPPFKTLNWQEL